ncbi:hypothetical protein BD413DRAFT_589196 [Trametes elegans]|nr:hypothetical protein BD413DRAFT_589196 [Trametes elegans]
MQHSGQMEFQRMPLKSKSYPPASGIEDWVHIFLASPFSGIVHRKGLYSTDSTEFVMGFTTAGLSMGGIPRPVKYTSTAAAPKAEVPVSAAIEEAILRRPVHSNDSSMHPAPSLKKSPPCQNLESFFSTASRRVPTSQVLAGPDNCRISSLVSELIPPLDEIPEIPDEDEAPQEAHPSAIHDQTALTENRLSSHSINAALWMRPSTKRSKRSAKALVKRYRGGRKDARPSIIGRTTLSVVPEEGYSQPTHKATQLHPYSAIRTRTSHFQKRHSQRLKGKKVVCAFSSQRTRQVGAVSSVGFPLLPTRSTTLNS